MKIVKLLNPNDIPFGKLSNNAFHPMEIDGNVYNTVTNYIYSNMLVTPLYNIAIRNAKIQTVPKNMNNNLLNTINFLIKAREPKPDTQVAPPKFFRRKNVDKRDGEDAEDDEDDEDYKYQDINIKDIEFPEDPIEKKQKELSTQVGIPFEKIDLLKLRQEVEDDEIIARSGIFGEFNKYAVLEYSEVLKEAIEKGFLARFEDLELAELLLQTGNVPIKYESDDELLGTGASGKGSNIVGQVLEQIRHTFQIKRAQLLESKQTGKLYVVYKAYLALLNIMNTENEDILEYDNLPIDTILSKYFSDHSESLMPTFEEFSRDLKDSKIVISPAVRSALTNPTGLVKNVRRENIERIKTIRNSQLDRKEDRLFEIYLEHMVLRNFEELSPEDNKKAVQQQLLNITDEERLKLKKRVVAIYEKGEFSDELRGKIEKEMKNFKVISEKEIDAILSQKVSEMKEDENDENYAESILEELSEVSSRRSENDRAFSLEQAFKMDKDEGVAKKLSTKKISDFEKSVLVVNLISQLVNITGNPPEMYKDMSIKELQTTLRTAKSKSFEPQSENKSGEYKVPVGHPLIVYRDVNRNIKEFAHLCPEFFNKMVIIESIAYPTIQHYVIAKTISVFTGVTKTVNKEGRTVMKRGMTMVEALINILSASGKLISNKRSEIKMGLDNPYYFTRTLVPSDFTTIEHAEKVYREQKTISDEFQLGWLTSIGLNAKFQDENLQNLLIITENAEIQWMSPENLFLGAGNSMQRGYNYVGKILMEIRNNVMKKHTAPEHNVYFREKKMFIDFIETDSIVRQWILVRVDEICGIINKFQTLVNVDLLDDDYEKFIKLVVNNIYKNIEENVSKNVPDYMRDFFDNNKVPSFFVSKVKQCQTATNSDYTKTYNEQLVELYGEIETLETRKKLVGDSNEELEMFRNAQNDEWKQYAKLVHTKKELDNFKKNQQKELDEFNKNLKGAGKEIDAEIQETKNAILKLKRDASRRTKKEDVVIDTISTICWNKILMLIINALDGSFGFKKDEVRAILTNTLLPVFQECKIVVQNKKLNCTVSAMLNILTGIKHLKKDFKNKFDSTKLKETDLDIAESILLSSKYVKKNDVKRNVRKPNARFGFGAFDEDNELSDFEKFDDDEEHEEKEEEVPYFDYNPEENHPANIEGDVGIVVPNVPMYPTYIDEKEEEAVPYTENRRTSDIDSIKKELKRIDTDSSDEELNKLSKLVLNKSQEISNSKLFTKRTMVNFYSTKM
jgi:predicted NAD-dependent protein-ADP-ribosyltransferase YbiA (DUF1768 family)